LFSDIKENNRCFDKQCFLSKSERFLYEKAKELMETRPDVVLVCRDPADVPKDIRELAKSLEVKILKEDTDYETYHSTYGEIKFTIKKRGFFLDGYRKGQYDEVYLASGKGKLGGGSSAATKEKEKSGKLTASDIDDEIKRIQDREKRSKEIDVEKIHKATLEHIDKIKELKQPGMKWQPIDRGIMVFLLMESGGFRIDDELKKIKGLPAEPRERHKYYPEFFKALSAISDDNLAFLVRRLALEKYGNKNLVNGISTEDTTMRLIAEYAGIALPVIEKTQKQTAEARVSRIEVRISELRDKKKLLNQRPKKKAK
jgi:hypothetical protein